MGKAIITIEDTETGVKVKIEFDPPAKTHGDCTNAQYAGLKCLGALKDLGSSEQIDEDDDFDEDDI